MMNVKECVVKMKEKRFISPEVILSTLYFIGMLRFYILDYYVKDFRLYASWPVEGYAAKDGYSSLWIQICALIPLAPRFLTILCLFLLTLTLFLIARGSYYLLYSKDRRLFYFSLLIIYGASIWYYFYGKIFYDFPFAAAAFGLMFLLITKTYVLIWGGQPIHHYWYWICILAGFVMSWKMYNIFAVAGLGLLFLSKDESRKCFFGKIFHVKQILLSLVCALTGYVLPNYYLFICPRETVEGLSGFAAEYEILPFLLYKTNIVWDHVTDLPFNFASFCILSAIIICFLLPVFNKKWVYLLTALFITICLTIFINNFSSGHCWHGFTSGLFVVIFTIFLLSEINLSKLNTALIVAAALCQLVICFGYYIPKQIYWFNTTNDAIGELEEAEHEIYLNVCELIDELDGTFTIDIAVKRDKPVATQAMQYGVAWPGYGKYFRVKNYEFLNPLEATNYFEWRDLESSDNYIDNSWASLPDCEYVIYVIPSSFMRLSDVANIHCYDAADIIRRVYGEKYCIYLIKR